MAKHSEISEAGLRTQMVKQATLLQEARASIADLKLQIEDRGWKRLGNDRTLDGLDLQSIKIVSDELRGWITGGGIMKRIIELRGTYIYGDGFGLKGVTGRAQEALLNDNNIAKLFSVPALLEINRAHGTDGNVVFLVHKKTLEIIRLPLDEMQEPYIDSDDRERIWYIRRTYTRKTSANPQGEEYDKYIVATTCPAGAPSRAKKVDVGGGRMVDVDQNYNAVLWKVNGQTGWALGIPDLLAALQWAEKHTSYLKSQTRFAEALAMLAWQYKSQSTDQAKRTAAAIEDGGTAGSAVGTSDMDVKPLPGSSAVSFSNGDPLAGQAAAAGEVPLEALLGNSMTSAGGNLDPDFVRVVLARRESVKVFIRAIGKLFGAPDLEPVFFDIESETPFREAQMMVDAWGTGLFSPEEIRTPLSDKLRLGIKADSTAPDGVLIPNNKATIELSKPDPTAPAGGGGQNKQGQDGHGVGKLSDGDNTARDKGEV